MWYWAEWAHSHWVWLDSGAANQASELELVRGYLARNIPVWKTPHCAVLEKLLWSETIYAAGRCSRHRQSVVHWRQQLCVAQLQSCLNADDIVTLWCVHVCGWLVIWNRNKYPNASQMVEDFHKLGVWADLFATQHLMKCAHTSVHVPQVRVILWVTSVINTDSSNYPEAIAKNYIVKVWSSSLIQSWHSWTSLFLNTRACSRTKSNGGMELVLSLTIQTQARPSSLT